MYRLHGVVLLIPSTLRGARAIVEKNPRITLFLVNVLFLWPLPSKFSMLVFRAILEAGGILVDSPDRMAAYIYVCNWIWKECNASPNAVQQKHA